MEFFNDLSVPVKFLIAFIVVLALLGVGTSLVRRLNRALGPRPRQPRLAVIDAASVNGTRRLVLVRRDNVEHLLLIGGPTDVVVEPNIDRTRAAPTAPVRDTKLSPTPESPPRQTLSLEGSGWPPRAPVQVSPPRPDREVELTLRGPMPLEPTVRPSPVMPPSFEPMAHSPPGSPLFEPVFQIPPAPEPKRMLGAPPLPSRPAQSEESNLSEMAQRLEAALRRPIKPVEQVPPPSGPK
jgi:flagellar protein FliO/FliZ